MKSSGALQDYKKRGGGRTSAFFELNQTIKSALNVLYGQSASHEYGYRVTYPTPRTPFSK